MKTRQNRENRANAAVEVQIRYTAAGRACFLVGSTPRGEEIGRDALLRLSGHARTATVHAGSHQLARGGDVVQAFAAAITPFA